jgi:hypothetical protein
LTEGLVRSDGVVDDLLGSQSFSESSDRVRWIDHLVELLAVGSLGTFDVGVELVRVRQDNFDKALVWDGAALALLVLAAGVDQTRAENVAIGVAAGHHILELV